MLSLQDPLLGERHLELQSVSESNLQEVIAQAQHFVFSALQVTQTLPQQTVSYSEEVQHLKKTFSHLMEPFASIYLECSRRISEAIPQDLPVLKEKVGKIVWIADRKPQAILENFDAIDKIYEELMHFYALNLRNRVERMCALSGGDVDVLFQVERAKECAKLLLTRDGVLNLGIIPQLKRSFFREEESGPLRVLQQLDISWQELMDAVELPLPSNVLSQAMIRADMELLPFQQIALLHCQQEALSALLYPTPFYLGPSLVTTQELKKGYLKSAFQDYSALIHRGYLTRALDGSMEDFSFEMTLPERKLHEKIKVFPDGKIDGNKDYFWHYPEVMGACHLMGIQQLECHIELLLHKTHFYDAKPKVMTWEQLIGYIAQVVEGEGLEMERVARGKYGFSMRFHRLVLAREAALAVLFDREVYDERRIAIYQSTKKACHALFNQEHRLVYNAGLFFEKTKEYGGFELRKKDDFMANREWPKYQEGQPWNSIQEGVAKGLAGRSPRMALHWILARSGVSSIPMWIEEKLMMPGLKVSRACVTAEIKEQLRFAIEKELLQELSSGETSSEEDVNPTAKERIENLFEGLNEKSLTIHEYSEQLLEAVETLCGKKKGYAFKIDAVLLDALPLDLKEVLNGSAVKCDAYLFSFNPRTEAIQVSVGQNLF